MSRFSLVAIILVVLVAVGSAVCAQTMQQLSTDITKLMRDAVPSVVSITSVQTFSDDENANKILRNVFRATGTGFVVEPGYVLTTDTVVANATEMDIAFPDGTSVKGTLAGRDPATNTALIKIDKPDAKPLQLGNSDNVKPGALIVSVNNRSGATNRATLGIVSATDARMAGLDTPVLQISGDIGPGASGGPIFDSTGKVVGMTVAMHGDALDLRGGPLRIPAGPSAPDASTKAKPSQPKTRVEICVPQMTVSDSGARKGSITDNGIVRLVLAASSGTLLSGNTGYAVPSNIIMRVLDSLKSGKEIVRGYVGMFVGEKNGKIEVRGVEPDSPATTAGVKVNDILLSASGKTFSNQNDFRDYVSSLKPGDSVKLKISREGKEIELAVTVGKRPAPDALQSFGPGMQDMEKRLQDMRTQMGKSGANIAIPDLCVPVYAWTKSLPTLQPIGLNLKDAGIEEVGKALMDAYGVNVIVSDPSKITRKVSIYLNPKTITVDSALSSICHALSCSYKKDGETYIISPQ